jgi:hypothetical protein
MQRPAALPSTDIGNKIRPWFSTGDIGADEYVPSSEQWTVRQQGCADVVELILHWSPASPLTDLSPAHQARRAPASLMPEPQAVCGWRFDEWQNIHHAGHRQEWQ